MAEEEDGNSLVAAYNELTAPKRELREAFRSYAFGDRSALAAWCEKYPDKPLDLSEEAFEDGDDLSRADLSNADLHRVELQGVILIGANLRGANLRGALLNEAHLSDSNLEGADLSGADLTDAVGLTTRQIARAKGLEDAILKGTGIGIADLVAVGYVPQKI